MFQNAFLTISFVCALVLLGSSCTKKEDSAETKAEPTTVSIDSLLISLPTSMSAQSNSNLYSRNKSGPIKLMSEGSDLGGIYNGIRQMIGISDMMASMIKEIIKHTVGASNPFGVDLATITEATPFVYTASTDPTDGSPSGIKVAKNATGAAYTYTVSLYWKNNSGQYVPGLVFDLTSSSNTEGSGQIVANLEQMSQGANDGGPTTGKFKVIFNTADATLGKTMSVEGVGLNSTDGGPTNFKLQLSSKNNILTASGNMYFPTLGGGDNPIITGARNYIFIGKANESTNVALMSLALPPSTNTDATTALFTDYSLSSIFRTGLVENMLGAMNGGANNPCCCSVGTYLGLADGNICTAATTCTNPAASCSAKSQTTATIVTGINSYCVANPTNDMCTGIGYIFKMTNPAYFDSTGFIGTSDYNTPSSGYDGLSTSGITFESANTIKELTISFVQTPVTTIQ